MYHLAKKHFKKVDSVLHKASLIHKVPDIKRSRDVFRDLVHAITNQQLSGKAADTIFGRLVVLLGKKTFNAVNIAKIPHKKLRSCGLSEAKATTIHGLAQAIVKKQINVITLHKHKDHEIIESLTSLKGIGPWTAEMVLMFSLGRTDIFSKGDLGLRKGMMYLYGLKKMPSDAQIEKLSKKWSPYRTYAARVLWRVADARK